ncbi:hypothetical protein PSTG_03544 [Puccinia striiformis f. sp. tritici PST-78]|uniref:Secreted protein n=1 Tax=Puccinia striiformis f. sp. tritici PST-78 TaxID=1165861 RepID=A0A0L0VVE7_9BASI|nr:hypothetical protein PSTG_03544 [Puccinia striiformis f. sp. tritici PST-78]
MVPPILARVALSLGLGQAWLWPDPLQLWEVPSGSWPCAKLTLECAMRALALAQRTWLVFGQTWACAQRALIHHIINRNLQQVLHRAGRAHHLDPPGRARQRAARRCASGALVAKSHPVQPCVQGAKAELYGG